MTKKKLLHIMMGRNNPDLQRGLDFVFECMHIDWLPYQNNLPYLQQQVVSMYNDFSPDVVFMHLQTGDAIYINTARYFMEKSLVFSWTGDVRHPLPSHYIQMGQNITSTLFTNETDVDICRNMGITADYLQVGFDKVYFSPMGSTNPKYADIIFMGTNYAETPFPLTNLRYEMCVRMKREFGSRFQIFGNGWGPYSDGLIRNYADEGEAYRSCKIAINLSHFAYKRYSSDRMFRIMGSGAFCLTHYFPDIEKDFLVGEELVVWQDLDDLIEKCHYYLQFEEERKKISIKGCFKARTQYTWNHFAENLNQLANVYSRKLHNSLNLVTS